MAVTLKSISERAEVSLSAVSQILNNCPNDYSSEATRARVLSIARELGYRQKFGDKLRRGDRTHTVAILLAMHRLLFEEQNQSLVLNLLQEFNREGYATYLQTFEGGPEANCRLVRELIARGTDKFICIGCPDNCAELERIVVSQKRSIVGFASQFSKDIRNDSRHALRETIRSFLASGRPRFKILLGTIHDVDRIQVVREIFPALSLDEIIRRHIVFLDFNEEIQNMDEATAMGRDRTAQTLAACPDTQALYYLSDYFMLGGLQHLVEHGYRIGKDIVLCGHNFIHAVRNSTYPLESWKFDLGEIIREIIANCSGDRRIRSAVKPIHVTSYGGRDVH